MIGVFLANIENRSQKLPLRAKTAAKRIRSASNSSMAATNCNYRLSSRYHSLLTQSYQGNTLKKQGSILQLLGNTTPISSPSRVFELPSITEWKETQAMLSTVTGIPKPSKVLRLLLRALKVDLDGDKAPSPSMRVNALT